MAFTAQRLRTHSVWLSTLSGYGVAQLVIAAGSVIRIPLLISALGPDGYGVVIAVGGIAILVSAITDGLAQATRAVAAENPNLSLVEYKGFLRLSIVITVACWIVVAFALFIAAVWLNSDYSLAVCACLLGASIGILGGPSRGILEARGKTALAASLQMSTVFLGLPLLALSLHFSPTLEVAAFVTGVGIGAPGFAALVIHRVGGTREALGPVSTTTYPTTGMATRFRLFISMVFFSWANALNYSFDAAIILSVAGPTEAGIYGLASRIMTLGMMMSLGLNPLISTYIARWRASCPPHQFKLKVWRLTLFMGVLGLLASVVSVLVGPFIADLLSGGSIDVPLRLFLVLAVFSTISSISSPLTAAFSGAAVARFRAIMATIFGFVNFGLTFVLVQAIGAEGASVASSACLLGLSVTLFAFWKFRAAAVMTQHR